MSKKTLTKLVEQADNMRGHAVAPLFSPVDNPVTPDERTLRLASAAYDAAVALQDELIAKRDTATAANRENATKPRKDIPTKAELFAAVDSYVATLPTDKLKAWFESDRSKPPKDWKAGVALALGQSIDSPTMQTRTLSRYMEERRLADADLAARIVEHLTEQAKQAAR